MRKRFLLCLLLAALATFSSAADFITFGLQPKSSNAEHAAKLAARFGKLVRFDSKYGLATSVVRTKTAKQALDLLRNRADVSLARISRPELAPERLDLSDAESLKAALEEFKARNEEKVRQSKLFGFGPLEKADKIKTGYYESHLFWLEQRAYPKKRIDYGAYDRAVRHIANMPTVAGPGDGLGANDWEYLGPTNLDIPYTTYYGIRPINGRVNAFAVDPTNSNIMYLGSANGGVWKSTDHGTSWTPLTDHWPYLTVSSIAIDPSNPQTIYVGTGDFPGGKNFTQGMMKSTNGGASWSPVGGVQLVGSEISSIVIDPENTQIVTITAGRGTSGGGYVWRSTDGGLSWTRVINIFNQWFRVEIGPLEPGNTRAYYCVGSGTDHLWKSSDRGATWVRMSTPYTSSITTISVAASPSFPGTVYLMNHLQVWKSVNYGASWTNTTGAFPNGSNNYFWSQFSYNWFFECSSAPGPQDVLYVGAIDVAQSPNGGATWQSIGGPTFSNVAKTHNDQHFVYIDPQNPNRVYIGGDGGAYEYLYNPANNTGAWSYFNRNLGVTQFYRIATHPTNPDHVMGGTQDNATPHSLGNLANWENVGGGDGGFCDINPLNPSRQYATSQNLNIYRTANSWSTSSGISPSTGSDIKAFIAPIVLDPNNPDLLYAGTNYLWRRSETTGTWEARLGGQLLSATSSVRFIAVAPGDGNRIYSGAGDGQVWMTTNAGSTWTQINTGTPNLPNRVVTQIAVNPNNKNDILVSFSGTGAAHLWRCRNVQAASRIWEDVDGSGVTGLPDTPANSVVIDPFDFENTWWAATDLGMFKTEDAGQTWLNATQPLGLPNTSCYDLKWTLGTGYMTLGTFGRGMWRLKMPTVLNPSAATTVQGSLFGGGLNELRNSDDLRYSLLLDEGSPVGEVQLTATAPSESVVEIQVLFELASSHPNNREYVELYDYTANSWVQVEFATSTAADRRVTRTVSTNASRFVQTGTRQVKARVRWIPVQDLESVDGWGASLDRFVWRTSP